MRCAITPLCGIITRCATITAWRLTTITTSNRDFGGREAA
jgi:hypothetical protein